MSFAQVGIVNFTPQAIVAKKDMAADNLKAFIDYLKANHSKLSYGHAGVGSISHVSGLVFNSKFGLQAEPDSLSRHRTGDPGSDRAGGSTTWSTSRSTSFRRSRPARSRSIADRRAPSGCRACRTCRRPEEAGTTSSSAPGTRWSRPRTRRRTSSPGSPTRSARRSTIPPSRRAMSSSAAAAPKGTDRGPAGLQKLVESEVARITPVIKAAGVTAN